MKVGFVAFIIGLAIFGELKQTFGFDCWQCTREVNHDNCLSVYNKGSIESVTGCKTCESFVRTDLTGKAIDYWRNCTNTTTGHKETGLEKIVEGDQILWFWYCNAKDCNGENLEQEIKVDMNGVNCFECDHRHSSAHIIYYFCLDSPAYKKEFDRNCDGVLPGKKSRCVTTVRWRKDNAVRIFEISRGCAERKPTDLNNWCSEPIIKNGVVEKSCYCHYPNGCNFQPHSSYETEGTFCITCKNCQDAKTLKTIENCSKSPESCRTNIYGPNKIDRDCTHALHPREPCQKMFDNNLGVSYISCDCYGKTCNEDYPQQDKIDAAHETPLYCVKCTTAPNPADNDDCKTGKMEPKVCSAKTELACKTTVTTKAGVITSVDRGCAVESVQVGVNTTDTDSQTYYCKTDGCNKFSVTNGREDLQCLSCEGGTGSKCTQPGGGENAKRIPCPYKSCFYEETKVGGVLTGVKRGCSEKIPMAILALADADGCEDLSVGVRRCYCSSTDCNRNSPKGIQCLQCEYHFKLKSCSSGDKVYTKTCRVENAPKMFTGAVGASCKEEKVTDTASGIVLGYSRGCTAYRTDECDPTPYKQGTVTMTSCYCNTDGCTKHKVEKIDKVAFLSSAKGKVKGFPFYIFMALILGSLFYF